jgi:hypothetical protein
VGIRRFMAQRRSWHGPGSRVVGALRTSLDAFVENGFAH